MGNELRRIQSFPDSYNGILVFLEPDYIDLSQIILVVILKVSNMTS